MSTATARAVEVDLHDRMAQRHPNPPPWRDDAAASPRAEELLIHRPSLLRLAHHALCSAADAQEAVQATLLAAINAPPGFGGRTATGPWLHGILRHKITDIFRRQIRQELRSRQAGHDGADTVAGRFDSTGHWHRAPACSEQAAPDPGFAVHDCLARLPPNVSRAYVMRELLDLEVEEIAATLGILPGDCSVLLHRARILMHEMLLHGAAIPVPG